LWLNIIIILYLLYMSKLKLINLLKNHILEHNPFSRYNDPIDPDDPEYGKTYTHDLESNKPDEVGKIVKVEDVVNLECFPKAGKCPAWCRKKKGEKINGEMTDSQLKKLKNHSSFKLSIEAAEKFDQMEDKYFQETGKYFKLTDAYRTYATQWEIFDYERCQLTGVVKKEETDDVDVSFPGRSNHGFGEAVDLGPAEAQVWIKNNGTTWDWHWGENTSEPWHFTYNLK
jgi:hypothetical protein